MRTVIESERLHDIVHTSDDEVRAAQSILVNAFGQHVGMSSAACMAAAIKYVTDNELRHKTLCMPFYDQAWKYMGW
jgi:cysteine synthase